MKDLYTEVTIDAPPERVWEILSDFASFGDWNPFMPKASGDLRVGGRLEILMKPPGGKAMTIKPTVLAFDENKELRWLGSLMMRGIFDGEHIFELQPSGDGTKLIHHEKFRGILAMPIMAMINKSTLAGFEALNAALKARAEGGSSSREVSISGSAKASGEDEA